jgi:hypothetical protein
MAYPLVIITYLTTDDMPVVSVDRDVGISLDQKVVDVEIQAFVDSIRGLGPKNKDLVIPSGVLGEGIAVKEVVVIRLQKNVAKGVQLQPGTHRVEGSHQEAVARV